MKELNALPGEPSAQMIDWAEVHRSLNEVNERMERAWVPGPDEREAIFRERARLLDQAPGTDLPSADVIELVEFHMARETYGIESGYVRVVCPLRDLTPFPCTPPFVLGLINVRGKIISVVNLKKFLELPEVGLTDTSKAIVLKSGEMEFGILTDAVTGIRLVQLIDLQPSILTLTGIRADFLKGVAGDGLIVLDAARILSDQRIVVHEEVG